MTGLRTTPASGAALLLNLDGVFTGLLAWFVFHENFDRRVAAGMALIVAGGLVLSWGGSGAPVFPRGALAVASACLCWAIDNNLTRKVASADPLWVASIKGLVAGVVNTGIALVFDYGLPGGATALAALAVGLAGYGLSLALFVFALRHLGTARTGAYFSLGPFAGAVAAVLLLGEPVILALLAAGLLMSGGAWLQITERHEHEHVHEATVHSHGHSHDEHHRHEHPPGTPSREPHTHVHEHEPLAHHHGHYPDIYHRHGGGSDQAARRMWRERPSAHGSPALLGQATGGLDTGRHEGDTRSRRRCGRRQRLCGGAAWDLRYRRRWAAIGWKENSAGG